MTESMKKYLFAFAAIAALALGGSALAGAATNDSGSTGSTGSAGQGNGYGAPPAGARQGTPPDMSSKQAINPNEKLLTGDTADKVEAAAKAKVKGTVDRVETDDGGVYEAHITKSDGTHVEVKVNKQFKVTEVNELGAGRRGGPGGHDGPPPAAQGGYQQ